jgi:hypothetical protein
MSFSTRFTSPIIISDLDIDKTTPTLLEEVGSTQADGWDTVTQRYALLSETEIDISWVAVNLFDTGDKPDARHLYVQAVNNFKPLGANLYTFSVTLLGMVSTKPVVVNYDGAADQQQGTNIVTPDGYFESVSTHENTPTASVRYVTPSISSAPTDEVGTAKVPTSAPSVAASVWTSLAKFTYHYPNGWVLMASKTTRLAGTNLAFVDDRYQYIRSYSPRT